jgi:hypothetical protein
MVSAQALNWTLIFQEEFLVSDATAHPGGVNTNTWKFEVGNRDTSDPANLGPEGWGNGEPQYYTSRCAPTSEANKAAESYLCVRTLSLKFALRARH